MGPAWSVAGWMADDHGVGPVGHEPGCLRRQEVGQKCDEAEEEAQAEHEHHDLAVAPDLPLPRVRQLVHWWIGRHSPSGKSVRERSNSPSRTRRRPRLRPSIIWRVGRPIPPQPRIQEMNEPRPILRLSLIAFRGATALALLAVLVAGCSSAATPSQSAAAGPLQVVATTTVFAEMVQEVGGSFVQATSLVPANGDVHTFEPKPSDIRTVAGAKLLVMNGLGLDDWVEKTITNAAASGTPLVKLGESLPGVDYIGGESGGQNPHLWMNVGYGLLYVDRIEGALAAADPTHAAAYESQAAAYKTRLSDLDTWVRQQVETIPVANRKLVAFHDAFPYYARAYGITIVGVAVAAPGQDPSAGYTADLINAIRAAGVKAIFSEAQFPKKLIDALAAETGTTVVADLYDDALGDPPITTYEAVIRWDTEQLVKALQ